MLIRALKGIGEKTEKVFNKAGVVTVEDILEYYPRGYEVFEKPVSVLQVRNGSTCAVEGIIVRAPEVKRVRSLNVVTAFIKDSDGGVMKAVWFNAPYLRNTLKKGVRYIFRGRVNCRGDMYEIEHPRIYSPNDYYDNVDVMQPVYPLRAGLSNNIVIKCVRQALLEYNDVEDFLPSAVRDRYSLCARSQAVCDIHFPKSGDDFIRARDRLVFDEFFLFITVLQGLKEESVSYLNEFDIKEHSKLDDIIDNLPYNLTDAQIRTWREIKGDLSGDKIMNRLVQGDVGSGKTIIAFLALIMTALSGYQGAMMAPTEVLARQHYDSITSLIEENGLDIGACLLTGSMTAAEKRAVYDRIIEGSADIIIGTHALIQEKVNYAHLALVVTDEQHRFGVRQRETLGSKGGRPHVIVMSATPIPRTLAIVLYGDLDISVIDELPAERLPVKNCVVGTDYRPNAYRFIEREVKKGHQAYVICPMVEESEAAEGSNVLEYSEMLKYVMPSDIKVECLHGRMKPSEKNDIMERFARNDIQVLVSTTVVEVGVNVPNATVMMVEDAEKFGLAGLHQLRGRVGRGKNQSYCIFVNSSDKPEAKERLDILTKSNDGFCIANEDLRLRGPGDFFGVRQSGGPEFKLGDIIADASKLKDAADAVSLCAAGKFDISESERKKLETKVSVYMQKGAENINI